MFGPVVDVAIGLMFTFLMFALLLTTLLEAIAGVLQWRSKRLEATFQALIEGGKGKTAPLATLPVAPAANAAQPAAAPAAMQAPANPPAAPAAAPTGALAFTAVHDHPLVAGSKNGASYVTRENFTTALLFALRVGQAGADRMTDIVTRVQSLPAGSLRTAMETAISDAQGDWDKLRAGIEAWFDHAMDRMSGEYKRYTQVWTFIIGLAVAAAFNVDSITVAQRLFAEPALRKTVADQAVDFVKAHPNGVADTSAPAKPIIPSVVAESKALLSLSPIGWEYPPKDIGGLLSQIGEGFKAPGHALSVFTSHLPGWLITALAGMLGAPFWFDLLGKVISIRNAGPKPADGDAAAGKGAGKPA